MAISAQSTDHPQPLPIIAVALKVPVIWRQLKAIYGAHARQITLISVGLLLVITMGGSGFVRAEGGYPWAGAQPTGLLGDYWIDENHNGRYNFAEQFDPYGYTYRNCTSWVAWRLASLGATNMVGLGNAVDWPKHALARGIAVDTQPVIGDAAVWDGTARSPEGHLAFVERVNLDGSVTVSEYNKSLHGEYTTGRITRAPHYIHFLTPAQRQALEATVKEPTQPAALITPAKLETSLQPSTSISEKQPAPLQPVVNTKLRGAGVLAVFGADINGDHKTDIVTVKANAEGKADIYWKPATTRAFGPQALLLATGQTAADTTWLGGDVTGDGLADVVLIARRGDGLANLIVFRSQTTVLGLAEVWGATTAEQPFDKTEFLLGDVDGDNLQDVYVFVHQSNTAEPTLYWLQSQATTFAPPAVLSEGP